MQGRDAVLTLQPRQGADGRYLLGLGTSEPPITTASICLFPFAKLDARSPNNALSGVFGRCGVMRCCAVLSVQCCAVCREINGDTLL
jgi:hypothetical protein